MATIHPSYLLVRRPSLVKENLLRRFFAWCRTQQKNRFTWMAIAIAGHGCVITPITLLFIMIAGNNFIFWPMAMSAMAMSLVTNLAALPTRITIPVFFLSLLIDLVIVINCIAMGIVLL